MKSRVCKDRYRALYAHPREIQKISRHRAMGPKSGRSGGTEWPVVGQMVGHKSKRLLNSETFQSDERM